MNTNDLRTRGSGAVLAVSPAPCPCGHAWRQHDPETGECDAPARGAIGVCPCGRALQFHQQANALLSRLALSGGCVGDELPAAAPAADETDDLRAYLTAQEARP